MSSFTTFDAFRRVEGGNRYVLRDVLLWRIGREGSDWRAIMGPDRSFDLSVPWWLQWVLSPHNRVWLPAAAVHDYFLEDGCDAGFAAAEFRRAVLARVDRAEADRRKRLIAAGWPERLVMMWCALTRDRRVWPAFFAVLAWTAIRKAAA